MHHTFAFAVMIGAFTVLTPAAPAQTFLGPTPYLSIADSPFDLSGLGSTAFLEDCEDGTFELPGTSSCGQVIFPGALCDSVDGDDGAIDGSGNGGHSWFYGDGGGGIWISFNEIELRGLPTFGGLVWTDGGAGCSITFEAYDRSGAILGAIQQDGVGDFSYYGETAEDRFVGVEFKDGISAMHISSPGGGIEIDHIQFGGVAPQGEPGCYADCTGDGILDLFDFLCFVNTFNAGSPAANCDRDCARKLDLFDFLCYTNAFNAGC